MIMGKNFGLKLSCDYFLFLLKFLGSDGKLEDRGCFLSEFNLGFL